MISEARTAKRKIDFMNNLVNANTVDVTHRTQPNGEFNQLVVSRSPEAISMIPNGSHRNISRTGEKRDCT
jgi:hypothetical protein